MFTKKVLVLAVAGVLSSLAYAEPSVTLYGTADGGLVYQHVKNTGEKGTDTLALESGINDTTKWGLKGSEDLGNGTKVSFKLENGYNLDDGTLGNNNRLFGREALTVKITFATLSVLHGVVKHAIFAGVYR